VSENLVLDLGMFDAKSLAVEYAELSPEDAEFYAQYERLRDLGVNTAEAGQEIGSTPEYAAADVTTRVAMQFAFLLAHAMGVQVDGCIGCCAEETCDLAHGPHSCQHRDDDNEPPF